MKQYTLLVEIGTDELPAKFLKNIGKDFYSHIKNEFKKNNILYNEIYWFASPRHLAVKSRISIGKNQSLFKSDVYNRSDIDNCIVDKNLFLKKKNNKFSQNISSHVNILEFNRFETEGIRQDKFINVRQFKLLLVQIIKNALGNLINYETMRWGDVLIPFIRPVNTVTILLDTNIVSGRIFNKNINRIVYGNRYIKNNKIILNNANDYPNVLFEQGYVIVDYNIRKQKIRMDVEHKALKLGGVVDIKNDDFLEKITSSIEWPIILFGKFNKRFLKLPKELIIHIMQDKQQYFPVYGKNQDILLPYFIFVINIIIDNYNKIINDHENIINMRFLDAEFFLKNDNKNRLEDYFPKLSEIVFHSQLGSLKDKVHRITELSGWIANQVNENEFKARRAGYLCKCDLVTDVVLEFPEVQGIMGMYYAQRDGEEKEVALAQKEHYQPRYYTDKLPTERISCIVSIADKMDTISGIFSVKEFPTGSRDPFGLKRAAKGILNIVLEKNMPINLLDLISKSIMLYKLQLVDDDLINIKNDVYTFMCQRLCLYYRALGYKENIVRSVLNIRFGNIINLGKHIDSVHNFYTIQKEKGAMFNLVYKRISNLIRNQNVFCNITEEINKTLLKSLEEIKLFEQITYTKMNLNSVLQESRYSDALNIVENLFHRTNFFLDNVFIMSKNQNIKENRLSLIKTVKDLVSRVIDISVLLK
ncbi:glycyl-tRNA synthetase beta subunit [Candidatus Blochmanniella vafra str. BVAF]|uniref:Glycine--tRNA ligase beta subunit n=1 Tax=Blochmanniella vafra (strain BVAF) TaxID=859654 RepID=E8Q5W5_BLOVB|nr:glycine--tRNA ligase subunit beta [Candidatus Blochmannia vafer]ADV33434.1 glycyl-tRNA synthetase beta subunit [Candidatus Blochmannia vafer str. BVAF]